jgi:ABC-type lipoprotein release transport system permease subunit
MKIRLIGFWVRIAFLFLVRSGRTTAALSFMVVTAVAALIFLSALAVGVKDAMLRNTVGLFSGHITGYNLPVTTRTEELRAPGVESILKRIYVPGVLDHRGLTQPITLCGINPKQEAEVTAFEKKINQGRYPETGRNEILISSELMEIFNVGIGDKLQFSLRPGDKASVFSISGIYQSGLAGLGRGLTFCPLDTIPANNAPWSAALFLRSGVKATNTVNIYTQRFEKPTRFETWEEQMPDLRQLIDLEAISMVVVIFLVFGVVAIGIACSFVIFIIRNMREYGAMKAMGVTTPEMSLLIVIKVTLMNLMGCAAGMLIGVLAVEVVSQLGGIDLTTFTSHNRYFAVSGVLYPRLTAFSIWAPPLVSFVFSLFAAMWPAALVARKRVADILRWI